MHGPMQFDQTNYNKHCCYEEEEEEEEEASLECVSQQKIVT